MRYPVNEWFTTIQGEGSFTGMPATFIRLQGCPVGCPWCDTKHTWTLDPEHEVQTVDIDEKLGDAPTYAYFEVEQLVERCKRTRHVVLTGGEPCRYDLEPLTSALIDAAHTVQVETSGTHAISVHELTWITVSPKFAMPGGLPVLPDCIGRADELKLPVGKERDIETALALQTSAPNTPLYLQPLSLSAKATQLCVDAAIAHGMRLSLQTHRFINVR